MKAIITFARGWNALSAVRSLGARGVEVITGDEYAFAPASFSKYSVENFLYPNPTDDPDGFLDCLEEVIRENAPDDGEFVLMPFHKETYLIARNRARFEKLIRFALPTFGQIEQVHDKGTLALYCDEHGIPIPKTVVPETRDAFVEAARGFVYPAFVKLRRSAAAVGVKKVDSADEAIETHDGFIEKYGGKAILQQGVPGGDYCSTYLFDHGQPRATMTYHNLRSFPVKSGTGVLRETVEAPEMEKTGEALLAKLGWHGVAEIDFRWDGKTQPQLIEVNPRFWGGLTQAVEAGWDYPWLLYRLAVDGRVDPVGPGNSDVRTETPVMALLATLHEVVHDERRMGEMKKAFESLRGSYVRGNRRRALRFFFNDLKDAVDLKGRSKLLKMLMRDHKHSVSDVFKWGDPMPALGVLYPLAVFLKHGKLSTELLVSEGKEEKEE